MPLSAFLLIFFSVFLHVTWNMLSKRKKPSVAFYVLMSCASTLLWLPFFLFSEVPFLALPPRFRVLLGVSIFGEMIYMIALAQAYRRSDISLVYPIVRALPVLLVAGVTSCFGIGRECTVSAIAGMVLISIGCFLMPAQSFRSFSLRPYCSSVIFYIFLGASGTTIYTICDSCALSIIRQEMGRVSIGDTLAYLFFVELGQALAEFAYVLCFRRERAYFRIFLCHPLTPLFAGCCSSSAYALVLLAMGFVSNVSYVQAFRQMSLPLGFLAGWLILHEKITKPKLVGITFVLVGLLVVSLN